MEDFPNKLLSTHGMLWLRVLAHLVLSRRERVVWQELKGSYKRRVEWLLARVAGKDAVRLLLKKHRGMNLCPTDIDIDKDKYGRPIINGLWTKEIDQIPSISLSHTRGIATAIACESGEKCGIDVERLSLRSDGIEQFTLNSEESTLLKSTVMSKDKEWPLRIWCAKEAIGKALGKGLLGGPRDLIMQKLDQESETLSFKISGILAKEFPQFNDKLFHAHTLRNEDLIVASTIFTERDQHGK